ncbi:MAG: HAD family phosphatase [Cytophagaceae bacterium]|nr:HAD family phosphatase [Cytophagaceae bacterium]MDW8457417.1 HAD family phosphatase [Cytophagaceae bacterium]
MKYKAAIFDMDGVLADNHLYHLKAFEIFCQKYGITLTEDYYNKHITGRTNEAIMRALFGNDITHERINLYAEEKEAIYRQIYKGHVKHPAGLITFLNYLNKKNIPCAVGSNGPFVNIDFVLQELDIKKYFSVIVNATMVQQGKPAPDVYIKAAELTRIPANLCLVFEDSPTGIQAAVSAGMHVVGIITTHHEHELKPTLFNTPDFSDKRLYSLF